jgi:hypothetical protein
MNARIGFKLHVTATLGCHSHYDCCFQTMCLFLGALEDPDDDTVGEMHHAEPVYSAVQSVMNAFWTEDKHAQQDGAHRLIQIASPRRSGGGHH